MKYIKYSKYIFSFFIALLLNLNLTFGGIIESDDILPFEISYPIDETNENEIKMTFRFFVPKNVDKNGMPTFRGYGAANGQYIGIQFNGGDNPLVNIYLNSCLMIQTENNINIPLKPENSVDFDGKTFYCKINSYDNTHIILPGFNYKLIIALKDGINLSNNLISITIFTTSCPKADSQIFDIGTFNHINIFNPYSVGSGSSYWPIRNLEADDLEKEVGNNFDFQATITFDGWFSWDDYIICLSLPKNEVILDNPNMKLSKVDDTYSNVGIPIGSMYSINLESDEKRKIIGFYLDGSIVQNKAGETLSMTFSGLKINDAGLIHDKISSNNYIEIQVRYRNSYVICARKNIKFTITLGTVKFEVKHPETDEHYTFDVFQGGAFQIEFTINLQKNVDKKYFFIKQKKVDGDPQRVTFIASSCDFSGFNVKSNSFKDMPKCYPIQNKNDGKVDDYNGIFFYYPNTIKAYMDYKLKVWIFFDVCNNSGINFILEIHNNINKNKFGHYRIIDKSYIFVSQTSEEIICYNTYMGEKNYYNGYLFNMDEYAGSNILYREYFNWNIYKPDENNLSNIFDSDYENKQKFIYSKKNENKISENTNLLLINKITLDSGNNEKLGQFFPMGLFKEPELKADGKFFLKLSKNFFAKNGNNTKCYVSWAFGSPSITQDLVLEPTPKYHLQQKYNFITNTENWFNDPTVILNAYIKNENIKDYCLESEINKNDGEWYFGDEENLEDQISDDSPVEVYFGLSDACHHWKNLDQTISSLYTPIEIILGIKKDDANYSIVMRFIKLFPEGGVWHDNIINEGDDIFIRSNDFIIKNHFAYNKVGNNEDDEEEKGVCLLEIMSGILDSQRYLSSNFFLWIFMGSLLDTEYEEIGSTYPVGNLPKDVNAYGYSSQHSLNPNNFYAKPPFTNNKNSDIFSPIYNIATSMNSIHQSATSGYLFYLGSLIILDNRVKTSSFYDKPNSPLIIPYYCPFYHTIEGAKEPYSLGIFPSFIAGFGSFNSITNFGNRGFDKLVAKKINKKQLNVLMLSGIKIYDNENNNSKLRFYYNTVKFINNFDNTYSLDVWNCKRDKSNSNEYDSIDSFIFFFNSKIMTTETIIPQEHIPSQLKSLTKTKKSHVFYAYGKKFIFGIFGVTNSDLLLTRNTPISEDKTPYLSININYPIQQNLLKCDYSDNYCPNDLIAFWGISSNHDMNQYVSNYDDDKTFFLDFNIYRTYLDASKKPGQFERIMLFKDDPAIYIKFTFYSPFEKAILANTVLLFKLKTYNNLEIPKCSVQSQNFEFPSSNCITDEEDKIISCQLIQSSMKYDIFCFGMGFNLGKFSLTDIKLEIPNGNIDNSVRSLIFEDNDEYPFILLNSDKEMNLNPKLYLSYITKPLNKNAYSKLELILDMQRPAYPGMKIKISIPQSFQSFYDSFKQNSECIFSLSRINNTFSFDDLDMDEFWNIGNSIIYKCILTTESSTRIIEVNLDDKIYKIGKDLSNMIYIYIWPCKVELIPSGSIDLSITFNNNNQIIISKTGMSIINNNQNIGENNCISEMNFSIEMSSRIYGDLSDYIFSGLSAYSVQIFFPKEITFECEECVKCYQGNEMIKCNFEDYNILKIYISEVDVDVVVTGIINPRTILGVSDNLYIFLNLINRDRNIQCSGNINITSYYFKSENIDMKKLRFFYLYDTIKDKNPRSVTEYKFRFGIDYANINSLIQLDNGGCLYIYFPRDYHLYINKNINVKLIKYYYKDNQSITTSSKVEILGRKIKITLTDGSATEIQYIDITINNIKNPNKIVSITENITKNKYTGYFKIVYISYNNSPYKQNYYITGINSNTYRSDYITDENLRSNEFNWHRGNLIQTDYKNKKKLILDVLNSENNYNFIFLQPGRYTKAYFVTSSDNENTSDFYLNPSYVSISFPNSTVKTIQDNYIIPSLFGEPYEFYIGVPCSTKEGIYVVQPKISNEDKYIVSPSIIINVRQIESAKIRIDPPNSITISPLNAKGRIYYYLSDINVDTLNINWEIFYAYNQTNKIVNIDGINIPEKTYTNYDKKISNIFSNVYFTIFPEINVIPLSQFQYNMEGNIVSNTCYQFADSNIYNLKELNVGDFAELLESYRLSYDLTIKNSENDAKLLANEIKFEFFSPVINPSFIFCELYCKYKSGDDENSLHFLDFNRMKQQLDKIKQNNFRKYASSFFKFAADSASLTFSNVIKGYQYNAQCVYQTNHINSNLIKYKSYTLSSEQLHSTFPAKTRCNTFYFISPINEEIQQKYINYCQYIIGKNCGNEGCIICSDVSGKIIPPGFSLYFPFNCQKEQCYDKSNSFLINEMYSLSEEFNSGSKSSKYEFTICATSNRICSSQISEEKFTSTFNQFVNNIKTTEAINKIFNIDYNDINYVMYNIRFSQNSIFIEKKLKESDITIEFITEFNRDGNAIWKGLYNSEVNFNILCFWRVKSSTENTPTLEEMTNCVESDSFCGIFVANYGGHEYQIPEYKRSNVVVGLYTLYTTCSYFVPSPVYFTPIKDIKTIEIKEEEQSFSRKILNINYINLFLFLIIFF